LPVLFFSFLSSLSNLKIDFSKTEILKIVVDKLMDNYERAGPERNSVLEDLRRYFMSFKGMICFTKAMMMNVIISYYEEFS